MSTLNAERPRAAGAIEAEVLEIVCEVLDVEPFEVVPTSELGRHRRGTREPAEEIAATLECAFGVSFAAADIAMMVNLDGVCRVLMAALRAKWMAAGR